MSNLTEGWWGWDVRLRLPSVRKNMPSVPGSTDLLTFRTTGAASRRYLSLSSRLACRPAPSLPPLPPTARHKERRWDGAWGGGIETIPLAPSSEAARAANPPAFSCVLPSRVSEEPPWQRPHPTMWLSQHPLGWWRSSREFDAAPTPLSALVILPCCHYLLCRWPPKLRLLSALLAAHRQTNGE